MTELFKILVAVKKKIRIENCTEGCSYRPEALITKQNDGDEPILNGLAMNYFEL